MWIRYRTRPTTGDASLSANRKTDHRQQRLQGHHWGQRDLRRPVLRFPHPGAAPALPPGQAGVHAPAPELLLPDGHRRHRRRGGHSLQHHRHRPHQRARRPSRGGQRQVPDQHRGAVHSQLRRSAHTDHVPDGAPDEEHPHPRGVLRRGPRHVLRRLQRELPEEGRRIHRHFRPEPGAVGCGHVLRHFRLVFMTTEAIFSKPCDILIFYLRKKFMI